MSRCACGIDYLTIRLRNYLPNSDVQCGQRVALIGMVVKQCGHSLVVGSAGGGAFLVALAALTIMKITKAILRKSFTV